MLGLQALDRGSRRRLRRLPENLERLLDVLDVLPRLLEMTAETFLQLVVVRLALELRQHALDLALCAQQHAELVDEEVVWVADLGGHLHSLHRELAVGVPLPERAAAKRGLDRAGERVADGRPAFLVAAREPAPALLGRAVRPVLRVHLALRPLLDPVVAD